MIKLIVGKKGSGKTKTLIDMISASAKTAHGNIVCIEKGLKLTYDIPHIVRLIDIDHYGISGYDAFYGFLSGIFAGNYDISEVYIDSILKIGNQDLEGLGVFFDRLSKLLDEVKAQVVFTVSADVSELPESVKKYL